MYAACAVRLNVGPVMPGAAAWAAAAYISAAAVAMGNSRFIEVTFCMMFVLIAASPLIDVNLGHQAAKVLSVVRQVIELGREKKVDAACRQRRRAGRGGVRGISANQTGMQDHVQRLAPA